MFYLYSLWKASLHRKNWLYSCLIILIINMVASRGLRDVPFWIAGIGTPAVDLKHGIDAPFPYAWILTNAIFIWISMDWLWNSWHSLIGYWVIKGRSIRSYYTTIWFLNLTLCAVLVLYILIVDGLLYATQGIFFNVGNASDMLEMSLLWWLGTSALSGLAFTLGKYTGNPYIGYLMASVIIIVCGNLFPNQLWTPGAQWMFGTHLLMGAPSFADSSLYLLILNVIIYLVGLIRLTQSF